MLASPHPSRPPRPRFGARSFFFAVQGAASVAVLGTVTMIGCGKVYDAADDPKSDASSQANDTGAVVVGGDGGGNSADGGSDSGARGDADAGLHFCQAQGMHTFCEDFDNGTVGSNWGTEDLLDGGVVDNDASLSAPFSASFTRASGGADLSLQRQFVGSFSRAAVSADVMLVAKANTDVASHVAFLDIALIAKSENPNWHLRFGHNGANVEISEVEYGNPLTAGNEFRFLKADLFTLPIGKWSQVVMSATCAPTKHGKVTVNGVSVFDEDFVYDWTPGDIGELTVGAFAAFASKGDFSVRLDNIVYDLQ